MNPLAREFAAIALPRGWHRFSSVAQARAMEAELAREISPGHVLRGRPVEAVARRLDRDDVLFIVDDPPALAQVHLTYNRESDGRWPHTELFSTLPEWLGSLAVAGL